MGWGQRKFNLIQRRAVYYQNVYSFSPYNVGTFKWVQIRNKHNIRQMYFMNPLKPTSRCERIS